MRGKDLTETGKYRLMLRRQNKHFSACCQGQYNNCTRIKKLKKWKVEKESPEGITWHCTVINYSVTRAPDAHHWIGVRWDWTAYTAVHKLQEISILLLPATRIITARTLAERDTAAVTVCFWKSLSLDKSFAEIIAFSDIGEKWQQITLLPAQGFENTWHILAAKVS